MQAVIMAGGKGTRLSEITKNEIPKPMVEIDKKPILLWQIEQLKKYDIFDITIVIGHLGKKIQDFFENGDKFGVSIKYIIEDEPLGSAGSLYYLKNIIKDKYFILIFGDIFFDIDISRMENFHKNKSALATLFVHPNSHPYDSDLIELDKISRVLKFDSKNNIRNYWYDNIVNAGIYIFDKSICNDIKEAKKMDLEKDILFKLVEENKGIYGYLSPEYVKDVGTVDRINSALYDLKMGLIEHKNLKNKQKAIFLDRDGTINKLNSFIYKEEDFEFEEGSIDAIKAINNSKYLAIVITNQPVVARGLCLPEDVDNIHKKMKTLLGMEGAYLDAIYYCPHHPDKGYPEENKLYKIDCDCRKPKIEMIKKAQERFNLDLSQSYIVGDSSVDMEMGKRAGLKKVLVLTGLAGKDGKYKFKEDILAINIKDAIYKILKDD